MRSLHLTRNSVRDSSRRLLHSRRLTAGDGGDDADFVAILKRRLAVFEEADVFLVHVDIHEAADFALLVNEAFLDAGEARLQFLDGVADGGGIDFDKLLVVGSCGAGWGCGLWLA